ncbi:hypothetical protein BDV10DRAFT_156109 [Aspergillus recurvatus]
MLICSSRYHIAEQYALKCSTLRKTASLLRGGPRVSSSIHVLPSVFHHHRPN